MTKTDGLTPIKISENEPKSTSDFGFYIQISKFKGGLPLKIAYNII